MPRYPNLTAWNHARDLVRSVTATFRDARGDGDLVSQIRRAAISVAANLAEGAERGSDRDFARFLRIADGSNAELQALITIAGDAGTIRPDAVDCLLDRTVAMGRLLGGLIRHLRVRAGSG